MRTFWPVYYGNTCDRLRNIENKNSPACPQSGLTVINGILVAMGGLEVDVITTMPCKSLCPCANGHRQSLRQYPFMKYLLQQTVHCTVESCRWRWVCIVAGLWEELDQLSHALHACRARSSISRRENSTLCLSSAGIQQSCSFSNPYSLYSIFIISNIIYSFIMFPIDLSHLSFHINIYHLIDLLQTYKHIQIMHLLMFVVALALILSLVLAGQPAPQCQTGFFYKTLPLIAEESYIINLDDTFRGYNLQYSTENDTDYKDFIKLSKKLKIQKTQYPDMALLGLKSYHLQRAGNSWGQQFIALTQRGQSHFVHYGILNSNTSAPIINNYIKVDGFANTTCFDSVLFIKQNLIIVDCVEKRASKNAKGQIYENVFYYYRISDAKFIKRLKTQMYVPFEKILRRKLDIYSDFQNAHTFLLRAYCSDGMSAPLQDNTYMEVFMINEPDQPWVVGVLDRSFVGASKLRIVDVKIYLGEIYILDQVKGLYRVYISPAEDLEFAGLYEARGFTRFAVYSPNLDNHMSLALANQHAVYEIDWTDVAFPKLVNKYSMMPYSNVSQVFINDRFLIIQSSSTSNKITYNYTWILNRGSRTYAQAFKVIKHGTANTLIDLNAKSSYLLVMDDISLVNYVVDQAILVLRLRKDQDMLDKMMRFIIKASSSDPSWDGDAANCTLVVNFTLLEDNNRTMWPIGIGPPTTYNSNYPGKLKIELAEYVIGPNVTYKLKQTQKGQLPKNKIYQQQQLNVSWENAPPFENITFLQTETFHGQVKDLIQVYMQDINNITYISYCYPDHEYLEVTCNQTSKQDLQGKINNWATTTFQSKYSRQTSHVAAYTTQKHYNTVFLSDLGRKIKLTPLILGKGFIGNVTSVSITGKFLYVVTKYIKRVNIYPLDDCLEGKCQSQCSINHLNMHKMGLRYFAPTSVHSSVFHDNIVFIKTSDSIIAVDMSKECVPNLLVVVRPVPDMRTQFIFQVNANYLVVTIAPDTVLQYDLSRLHMKQVLMTKKYPLYGYKLPRNYEFDISDYGNCVYLSVVNPGGDYNVFVYRSGYPAVGTLYDQIDLFVFQNLLLDASGYVVDYVTVISGKSLRMFRQYEYPEAEIDNPKQDYQFYLQYANNVDAGELQLISVKIINLPTYIKVNPFYNNIMNTKDLLYSGANRLSQINDSDWYEGNVLYIRPNCHDCGTKIRINNHIDYEQTVLMCLGLTDFGYTPRGGTVQTLNSLIAIHPNGTIRQIVKFPQTGKQSCLQIAVSWTQWYEISGCVSDKAVSLYVTSFVGGKGFVFQGYETKAKYLMKMEVVHQLLMLLDAEPNTYRKQHKGGIFLFELSNDIQIDLPLQELQYIDGDDMGMPQLGSLFINNAQLTYHPQTQTYRLYITEMTLGVFVVQFTHIAGSPDIIILQASYIKLKQMLAKMGETLPYDATYQAITLIASTQDPFKRVKDVLLVTTGLFHTIQLQIIYDQQSLIVSQQVTRFYLRYSYYEVANVVSHQDGLFLIKHVLPMEYDMGNQTQQLFTVYSTRGEFNGKVQKRGLIGAYPLRDNISHSFDFNLTLDHSDQHRQPRIGLTIIENGQSSLIRATLHRNLSFLTTQLLDTQIIYIDLINDFNLQKIRILINGRPQFPQWIIITIILFSIIGLLILLAGGHVGYTKWKERSKNTNIAEDRDTLITDSTYN